jgi:hypothetical protein
VTERTFMSTPPLPVTLRSGRFVLLGALGEGTQGITFDAVDKREGRPVAIKRFDVRGARSWKDVELAEREARVLQSFSHPKLPAYIDHFEEDGALYLVMEKIDGESLAARRARGAPFGQDEVVRLLRDAADVLDYLHGRVPPVIHRDLKPGNVIRRPDGSFAFVDFGAVRDKLRPKGGSTVVGTFGYMAPEQLQGRALPASDVYAMGATALTMLTGSEPEDLPHRGLAIDVRLALRGTGTGERLVGVLEKMLDPDPDRRARRIAPLLAERPTRRDGRQDARGGRQDPRESWREEGLARKAERRARHAARHAERAALRAAFGATAPYRWSGHASSSHRLPWAARLVFAILWTVGIVAVSMATQVMVPLVLSVLSLFFARRALSNAADAVRRAGHMAMDRMNTSRRWMIGAGVLAEAISERRGDSPRPPATTAAPPPEETRSAGAGPSSPRSRVSANDARARIAREDATFEDGEEADFAPDETSNRPVGRR